MDGGGSKHQLCELLGARCAIAQKHDYKPSALYAQGISWNRSYGGGYSLRSNGCARPQSDRRFCTAFLVVGTWVPHTQKNGRDFGFRLWVLDLAMAAARRRSLRCLANCAVNSDNGDGELNLHANGGAGLALVVVSGFSLPRRVRTLARARARVRVCNRAGVARGATMVTTMMATAEGPAIVQLA